LAAIIAISSRDGTLLWSVAITGNCVPSRYPLGASGAFDAPISRSGYHNWPLSYTTGDGKEINDLLPLEPHFCGGFGTIPM
jgi:hypothetical protein